MVCLEANFEPGGGSGRPVRAACDSIRAAALLTAVSDTGVSDDTLDVANIIPRFEGQGRVHDNVRKRKRQASIVQAYACREKASQESDYRRYARS
jgi:hypothetical protein